MYAEASATCSVAAPRTARSLAVEHEVDHLLRLADLIGRTTYRGRGLDGRPWFTLDGNPPGRPVHLTRAAVRRLVGPEPSDVAVARLVADLAAFAAEVQYDVEALVLARHVGRQADLSDRIGELLGAGVTRNASAS